MAGSPAPLPSIVGATPPIAALNADIFRRFPGTRSGGIASCRRKTGNPNEWSQHAWSNALDIMVPDRATGDRVAAYLRANAGQLRIGNILWWVKDHYDHVHVEGMPLQTGEPPCSSLGAAAGAIPGVGGLVNTITAVPDFLRLMASPSTWLRVLWAVGGVATLGAGVLMLAKEMGVPVPSPKDVLNTAKTVATKGLA